jgi:Asp-tRNA(Asn)/Glu-tRNA(Gln) amidotransferase A subunit family amidase
MGRTVEDATKVLEVIAGYNSEDPLTNNSKGKSSSNYNQFLLKDGLDGARIGVLRELSDDNPHPEIKVLFERALVYLDSLGAEIIDLAILSQNQWCASFREDVETFLAKHDTLKSIEDIIRVGTNSDHARDRLKINAANSGRWKNPEIPCLDAYRDVKRIAFRGAIENMMDSLILDANVYPTWNHPPARIDFFTEEYKGDNSEIISAHTEQPAFTVPMGFTGKNLPVGLHFLGRMYDEPTFIKLAYSYEQGTKHRKRPDL